MNNPSITCHRKPDDECAYMIKIITGTNIQTNANTYIKNVKEQTQTITFKTVNVI